MPAQRQSPRSNKTGRLSRIVILENWTLIKTLPLHFSPTLIRSKDSGLSLGPRNPHGEVTLIPQQLVADARQGEEESRVKPWKPNLAMDRDCYGRLGGNSDRQYVDATDLSIRCLNIEMLPTADAAECCEDVLLDCGGYWERG